MRSTCLIETLEDRRLLANPTASFNAGVLEIRGTAAGDELTVSAANSQLVVTWVDKTGATPQTRTIISVLQSATQRIRLFGEAGNDKILISVDIPALVHGGAGNDTITSAGGADTLYGEQGNDVIWANGGDDIVPGGDGNDNIHGGNGNDRISGNAGNDTLYGNSGNDIVYGRAGNDELHGGLGNDKINTGLEYNIPEATGASHDNIRGGAGDDAIVAGRADTVVGGAGHDTFARNAPGAWPTLDFVSQEDTRSSVLPTIVKSDFTLRLRPWQQGVPGILFRTWARS